MLDVSRHFFTVDQVKRYIDQLALYKINKLHLHLSDDQGWRIAIDSWPRLATYGGSTQVGGGPGGHYTKAQYKDIVRYAASRHLEVVPEIDMPGHTNAALASYPELNCDGVAPPLYTGTEVGFSSLCVGKPVTYDTSAATRRTRRATRTMWPSWRRSSRSSPSTGSASWAGTS
jgi:hexosaminidase